MNRLSTKNYSIGIAIFWLFVCIAYGQVSFSQASTIGDNPSSTKFIPYNVSKYGLSFEYPGNWNITERESGIWFSSPVDGTGNIGIQIQPAGNKTLQELVKIQLVQYNVGFKDFRVLSSNSTTLAGNAANRTDYSFKTEEPKFLGTSLFGTDILNFLAIAISTIKNDNLYTVTYISTAENYDIFLPIADKMMSSLRIQQ